MALYHMLNVGQLSLGSVGRCIKCGAARQTNVVLKQWAESRRQAVLLSSSLIVLQNNEERDGPRLLATPLDHAELSPDHCNDTVFGPVKPPGSRMRLLDELRDSFPSSSETLDKLEAAKDKLAASFNDFKLEAAKEKLTSSFNEFTERLNNEPLTSIINEHANFHPELVAESLSETLSETKEAIQTITQRLIVKSPEPGVPKPIIPPEPGSYRHVDLKLTEEIINQTKKRCQDEDDELIPRFKAAVRQFKAEIEADDSGDPPIALVSRKAKQRIEQFIRTKKSLVKERLSETLDVVKEISVVGRPVDKEEGVMEYITSNLPECDAQDPELQNIMLDSAGTFYNDSFLVDDIAVEDVALLEAEGWACVSVLEHLTIWKKTLVEENLSLYKIFGSFDSISAVEFYNAQVNDQYRSVWDKSVNNLYVVDNITNNREIVYWATKFPFPLQDRDYVFERSHSLDDKKEEIVIASRSITHKAKPEYPGKLVRVYQYGSKLVIKANQGLYEKGMSYVLTYYDDFGVPIPNQVKDRMATTKIPEFLDKVHEAALYLGTTGKLYVPYPEPHSPTLRRSVS